MDAMNDTPSPRTGFLGPAVDSPGAARLAATDTEQFGYVMNLTRMWSHQPALREGLLALFDQAANAAGLSYRDRGVLISAAASSIGDAYCSLAWGNRLAGVAGGEVAGSVLGGSDAGLDVRESALAAWARWVASDPNGATAADAEELRTVGYDDPQILAITLFVALRVAFAAVNDALGVPPDAELVDGAAAEVRAAVTFGRAPHRDG